MVMYKFRMQPALRARLVISMAPSLDTISITCILALDASTVSGSSKVDTQSAFVYDVYNVCLAHG